MTRTPAGVALWLRRLTGAAVAGLVAVPAAAVSYVQLQRLVETAGFGALSYVLPLSVDGLLVVATLTLHVRHRDGDPGGVRAWGALVLGVAASLAGNVAAVGAHASPIAHAVAAWPPLALFVSWELLTQQVRAERRRTLTRPDRPATRTEHRSADRSALTTGPVGRTGVDPDHRAQTPGPTGPEDRTGRTGGIVRSGLGPGRSGEGNGPDVSDLVGPGRAVARRIDAAGDRLSRRALIAGLREDGHTVSTARAAALLRQLTARDARTGHRTSAEDVEMPTAGDTRTDHPTDSTDAVAAPGEPEKAA